MNSRPTWAYRVRRLIAHSLYAVGLLQLWQRRALRHKAVVLMYHRVLTAEQQRTTGSHPAIVVDRDTFARHMALLKRRFNVLTVAEFADHIRERRPFGDGACLITFDDGWRDNYENAVPIMAAHDLPSLIFLPMNYIGQTRVFWQEALAQLLLQAFDRVRQEPARRPSLAAILERTELAPLLDLAPGPDYKLTVISTVSSQKKLGADPLHRLIADIAGWLGTPPDVFASVDGFIDWRQVAAMSRQRVTFGGHGVDHLLLTQVSDAVAEAEIEGSKRELDRRVSEPVPTFSYPNGSWTPKAGETVQRAGYQLAFLAGGGPVTCEDDPWTLRRVNIHESMTDSDPMFLARLVGLF